VYQGYNLVTFMTVADTWMPKEQAYPSKMHAGQYADVQVVFCPLDEGEVMR
jgi:hypothetical protein